MNPTTPEISGLIITLLVAFIAFYKSKVDLKSLTVLTAMCLGLIATLTLSIRFDVIPRIEKNQQTAMELASHPDATALIAQYVDAQTVIQSSDDEFFDTYVDERVNEFRYALDEASNGRYIVMKHEIGRYSTDLIATATQFLIATSYVRLEEWWNEVWAEQYLKTNCDLVERGVSVTRYFLFLTPEELEEAKPLIQKQLECGIDVFVVMIGDIDHPYTRDVIVVDDRIGGRLELTVDRKIVKAVMSTSKDDIREIRKILANLEVKAKSARTLLGGTDK